MSTQPKPISERFQKHVRVDASGCWLWTGATSDFGHGVVGRGRRSTGLVRAHRLAWELQYGPVPPGMFVCHKCDVPACVNPAHLFVGDAKDNSQDMARKGRGNYTGLAKATATRVAKQVARKTCKRGHRLSGSNLRIKGTSRKCVACSRLMQQQRRARGAN